jgi:hypothetical protein
MNDIHLTEKDVAEPPNRHPRSTAYLLAPLDRLAQTSRHLLVKPLSRFAVGEDDYTLPRVLFTGPKGGGDPIRLGLFAGVHGDELAGVHALIELLKLLEMNPELATGYYLFVYPVCNPTGVEDNTRLSRRGRDLNREFWKGSTEPEVRLLQSELTVHSFHGIISLHTDSTSHGLYGFANGATYTRHLLEPALASAEQLLPRNQNPQIDGFRARNGIIREGYEGRLSAPPKVRPRPFEIVLEMPQSAPQYLQEKALIAAVMTLLAEYKILMAYAPNL